MFLVAADASVVTLEQRVRAHAGKTNTTQACPLFLWNVSIVLNEIFQKPSPTAPRLDGAIADSTVEELRAKCVLLSAWVSAYPKRAGIHFRKS